MWIDLDLLYSIRETSYQYSGCFILKSNQLVKLMMEMWNQYLSINFQYEYVYQFR